MSALATYAAVSSPKTDFLFTGHRTMARDFLAERAAPVQRNLNEAEANLASLEEAYQRLAGIPGTSDHRLMLMEDRIEVARQLLVFLTPEALGI